MEVLVAVVDATPTVTLAVAPNTIQNDQNAILSWSTTDADWCVIEGIGKVDANGTLPVIPQNTIVYTITANNEYGSSQAVATLKVLSDPVQPLPEDSFGKEYEDLIPQDATITAYDPQRFSIVKGKVMDRAGQPIPETLITVHGHPEYGSVKTDENGKFKFPVEAGFLTFVYQKDNLIKVHRLYEIHWNEEFTVDTVEMIPVDSLSTIVEFDGDPETVITHQSSTFHDAAGKLTCSVVFTGDNKAYLTNANNQEVAELNAIRVRATQILSVAASPVNLPAYNDFNYAVDLSIDGVDHARFKKAVTVWVSNTYGFDVGEEIYANYYNSEIAAWTEEEVGYVVRLLDTDGDGVVDALDLDDDGEPDDINEDGSFSDEVTGLGNPDKYAPNSVFWRLSVYHFSVYFIDWDVFFKGLSILPTPLLTMNEGEALNAIVIAYNPDPSQPITYSAENMPVGATFNPSIQLFSWTPTYVQAGEYAVRFIAHHPAFTEPVSSDAKIVVKPIDPEVTLYASKKLVGVDSASTSLKWESENAVSCEIAPNIGSVGNAGEHVVTPTTRTTYTITALGYDGETATATYTVDVAPIVTFSIDTTHIVAGEGSATLTWSTQNAEKYWIQNPDKTDVPLNGSMVVSPKETTTFTINAWSEVAPIYPAVKSITLTVEVKDDDFDSLPDWWEKQYFSGDLGNNKDEDSDGDSFSNYIEYRLGTNPNSSAEKPDYNGISYKYDALGRIKQVVCSGGNSGPAGCFDLKLFCGYADGGEYYYEIQDGDMIDLGYGLVEFKVESEKSMEGFIFQWESIDDDDGTEEDWGDQPHVQYTFPWGRFARSRLILTATSPTGEVCTLEVHLCVGCW